MLFRLKYSGTLPCSNPVMPVNVFMTSRLNNAKYNLTQEIVVLLCMQGVMDLPFLVGLTMVPCIHSVMMQRASFRTTAR